MKSKITSLLFCFALLSGTLISQNLTPCAAHDEYENMMHTDKDFAKNQADLEKFTTEYVDFYLKQNPELKQSSAIKVIPVVFHVIHQGGTDNISRTQILDQIDIMNKVYQKLNADTASIPGVFKPLTGNADVEFRLAQLDPNGNCTDGVTRTYSNLTNNCRNNVKGLIYWPSNKYLNVWTVKSIANSGAVAGIVIGFAQFPGGASSTDGIVMRQDYIGSIGTAAGNGNDGRVICHEAGHWFNLRHIWGDAVCGNDLVSDTPTQQALNFGCPIFPSVTNCTGNAPNGDMFMNYMDYSDGVCQHMFSIGQCARMNAALNSSASGRNNLWTQANLIATGTDGSAPGNCSPIASINKQYYLTCAGGNVTFSEGSYNVGPFTYSWTFTGGNPSSSTSATPTINYATAGTYDVSLTVTNANGSSTDTKVGIVHVIPALGANAIPFTESFENITFPNSDWLKFSDISQEWTQTSIAAATGTKSVYLQNFTTTQPGTDEFITPSFNFSNVTSPTMTFKVAFAQRNSTATNDMDVYMSTNCGTSWTPRWSKTGQALSTITGTNTGTFVPTAAQWRTETVNINPALGKNSVMFKFVFTNNADANNVYVDDINLGGITSLNEIIGDAIEVNLQPNPTSEQSQLSFVLLKNENVTIAVYDAIGKKISSIVDEKLNAGNHNFAIGKGLPAGVYLVEMIVGEKKTTKRLLIQ
nr:PKD domain-containing protein [Bacteroidota bacterium]